MSRIRLFGGYYLGTGLLSVVGTSFATLSTANAVRGDTFCVSISRALNIFSFRSSTLCMQTEHALQLRLQMVRSREELVRMHMAWF